MYKRKLAIKMREPKQIKEQTAEATPSRQTIAKPLVSGRSEQLPCEHKEYYCLPSGKYECVECGYTF
jgi:hypothetical protein